MLLELVYEGGPILDLCLEAQREYLAAELRNGFASIDMRGLPLIDQERTLRAASKGMVHHLLIRGMSGLPMAPQPFPKAALFLDMLGKSDAPEPRSLSQFAFRIKRAFAYSREADGALRDAGIGLISKIPGPYFPRVNMDTVESLTVGVLPFGRGEMEVIGKLKQLRDERGIAFEILSTQRIRGTVPVPSPLEMAAQSSLLIFPNEQIDLLGPNEGGILAICTGRALCTCVTSALEIMPYPRSRFLVATRYAAGSYAQAVPAYMREQAVFDAWPKQIEVDPLAVPKEILRRLQ